MGNSAWGSINILQDHLQARRMGLASAVTPQNQDVGLCAVSSPAAAGPGWVLSGHGLVSAGWPAGLCWQIPAPGTETNTATAAVKLSGETKSALYNDITETGPQPV